MKSTLIASFAGLTALASSIGTAQAATFASYNQFRIEFNNDEGERVGSGSFTVEREPLDITLESTTIGGEVDTVNIDPEDGYYGITGEINILGEELSLGSQLFQTPGNLQDGNLARIAYGDPRYTLGGIIGVIDGWRIGEVYGGDFFEAQPNGQFIQSVQFAETQSSVSGTYQLSRVPEPSTYAGVILTAVGIITYRFRRHFQGSQS